MLYLLQDRIYTDRRIHMSNQKTIKLIVLIIALLIVCLPVFSIAEGTAYSDVPLKSVEISADDPLYYHDLWAAELYNYKMIRNFTTLYEKSGWNTYRDACVNLDRMDPEDLSDADKQVIDNAKALREALVQIIPYAEEALFIWGDSMPVLKEVTESQFTPESQDNADFRPFLIPYLMDDPSQAKGNLILISGGGNYLRGTEAQDVAPGFVALGYNCFVLHRRVAPYGADEIAMDLQRAIRYVKFHGPDMGLGGLNVIGAAGFSGGGGNVCTVIQKYYGDIKPDQFDPNYVCDEIDAVNSDMQIAMPIYSARALETENPNIPKLFIAVGEADRFDGSIEMFKWAYGLGLHPELHIFGNVVHGFGPGTVETSSLTWMEAADLYIRHNILKKEKYDAVPEEYTLKQTVTVTWFPKDVGDVNVDVYVNSDHSKFFLSFFSWGDDIQVEGILVGDNVAGVTFDSVGFFTEDAPKMWALADPSAWEPVQR